MKRTNLFNKAISMLLAIVIFIMTLPMLALPTVIAEGSDRVADTSTMDGWKKFFGPDVLSTEYAGGVWTDKSVFTSSDAFQGTGITLTDDGRSFLVALSAIASNTSISGYSNKPTDTMFVLDVSGSISSAVATQMVNATNKAIKDLMDTNINNRVGVILYSGSSSSYTNSTAAVTVLPLGRYNTTSMSGNYLQYSNDTISLLRNVTDASTGRRPSSTSKQVTGATYIQKGVIAAMDALTSSSTTVNDGAATLKRSPVVVLMSDGAPTLGSSDFTAPGQYNLGSGSSTTDALGFVTQLSCAYAKASIEEHYDNDCIFYTLGCGINDISDSNDKAIALSVLDPKTSTSAINQFWTSYNSASTGGSVALSTRVGVTKIATALSQNYSDAYFEASGSNDTSLSQSLADAFDQIVYNIKLQSRYYPTLVENYEDFEGNISFIDRIGEYMTVSDIKGILLNNTLFSGEMLSKNFVDGGDAFGIEGNPTELGMEFVSAVRTRLGLSSDDEAIKLIKDAYAHGQIYYDPVTKEFSNYIGWYANKNGEFLGFWYDGITTMPDPSDSSLTDATRPAYIIKSYGLLGEVDASQGVAETDMMYATIQVRKDISTGEEMVIFAVPAALIPIVSYDISLTGTNNEVLSDLTVSGATSPIRLVYEVTLRDDIDETNVTELVDDGYAYINSDGTYSFYTNKWSNSVNDTKVNTYSYFEPSTQNERYYYTADSTVYADTNGTVFRGTIDSNGTYYRQFNVYKKVGNAFAIVPTYEPISAQSLAKAVVQNDGSYVIPAGTIHRYLDNISVPKDSDGTTTNNKTLTNAYVDYPIIEVDDNTGRFYVAAVQGNNGKLTLVPETGIKITKKVTNAVSGASEDFIFNIVSNNQSENKQYDAILVDANGNKQDTSVTFASGRALVTLKDGESIYITGLDAGNVYLVSEVASEHYKVSAVNGDATKVNAQITVAERQIIEASFENSPREKGSVIIGKEVIHELGSEYVIPANKIFQIKVTLSDVNVANKTFEAVHSGNASITSVTTDANGSFVVSLGHDQQIEIKGLYENTVVTAEEINTPSGFTPAYYEGSTLGDGVIYVVANTVSDIVVVNSYEAKEVYPINITVGGDKIFTGRPDNAWEDTDTFTFELQKYVSGTWQTVNTQMVNKDNKAFDFTAFMQKESFAAPGTYSYQIIETTGSISGVTYDRSIYTFTIHVSDSDMDGQLEIVNVTDDGDGAVTFDSATNTWKVSESFVNTYSTTGSATVTLDVNKTLVNPSQSTLVSAAGFRFGLYDTAGNLVYTTPMKDALGKARLVINYTPGDIGTYSYVLKEIVPDNKVTGMTYSQQEYDVTIVVGDDTQGGITATIQVGSGSVGEGAQAAFENTYTVGSATLELNVTKNITGIDLVANAYAFKIVDLLSGNTVATGTNDASGKVTFDKAITFDKVGQYGFAITEEAGTAGGVTYDSTEYRIMVTVTDDGSGVLKASYVITSHSGQNIVFNNTYKADETSLMISGTKTLNGKQLLNDMFSFSLVETDAAHNVIAGGTERSAINRANGTIYFDGITYTKAGLYYYTITENAGNIPGVVYDKTVYYVTVEVTDNKEGKLIAQISSIEDANGNAKTAISFVNNYVPAPTDVIVSGDKVLTGKVLTDGIYTFEIYEATSDWTISNTALDTAINVNGEFIFSEIEYTKAGTYRYIVKEVNGGKTIDGVTYDATVFAVTVIITDNGNGQFDTQILYAEYYGDYTIPVNSMVFENTYQIRDEITVDISGTKVLTGATLNAGDYVFELFETDAQRIIAAGENYMSSVSNAANGSFSFSLKYTAVGTYYYVVREANSGKVINGITYDDTVYFVTVNVTDNGKGGLAHTVSIVDNNQAVVDTMVFTNKYEVVDQVQVDIGGTKVLTGKTLQDSMFTFNLYTADESGTVGSLVDSATNISGRFDFSTLLFDNAGTYYYVVREANGGLTVDGIKYDSGEYRIKVIVTDNGAGKFDVVTTMTDETGANVTDIVFENAYSVSGNVTVSLNGNKDLVGKELTAGMFSFELVQNASAIQTVNNNEDGTFNFATLTFTQIGTYVYLIREVNGGSTIDGVTYDNTVYTVTINVTDNGKGSLASEIVITKDGQKVDFVIFENVYVVTGEVEVNVGGTKEFTGATLEADKFLFGLFESNSSFAVANEQLPIITARNSANGSFAFDALKFNKAGAYYYVVEEAYRGQVIDGITYDSNRYLITVIVTDNGKGSWDADVTITDSNKNVVNDIVFRNEYNVTGDAAVTIDGSKTLTGRDLPDGAFFFELYASDVNKTTGALIESTRNFSGKFTFSTITYTQEGTYYYLVKEAYSGQVISGVTFDDSVFHVTVTVEDNGVGGLAVTKVIKDKNDQVVDAIGFTNSYAVTGSVSVILNGLKQITGKTLKAGEFTFELVEEGKTDAIETVSNSANGEFSFTSLSFTQIGEYKYVVYEVNGGKVIDGVTYDAIKYYITVKVTDNGKGGLAAETEIVSSNNVTVETMRFNNSYKVSGAVSETLSGTKVLEGKTLKANDFSFELYKVGRTYEITPGSLPIEVVKNIANGNFTFATLEFVEVGTHFYIIKEVDGGKTIDGITYDATEYRVMIDISDDGKGNLIKTTTITDTSGTAANVIFTNKYAVTGSVTVELGGKKQLTGAELKENMFTFELFETDASFAIADGQVAIQTVANSANGDISFTELAFTEVGKYYYVVREANGGKQIAGITYDDGMFYVTVSVTDNGVGGMNVQYSITDENKQAVSEISFTNTYSVSGEAQADISGTKELTGRELKDGEFTFELYESDENMALISKIDEAQNYAGKFNFETIKYTKLGTYYYVICEVNGGQKIDGVTYDATKYLVIVTVSDNKVGGMDVDIRIVKDSSDVNEIVFANAYSVEGSVQADISGSKQLGGNLSLKGDDFVFELFEQGSTTSIATAKNDINGLFKFDALNFTAVGEYIYEVREANGGQVINGITYDKAVYTVKVTVADNGVGGLDITVQYLNNEGQEVTDITFVNEYSAQGTSVEIGGTKKADGFELMDEQFEFVLYAADSTWATGSAIEAVKNFAGKFTFSKIEYTEVGTYYYVVSELGGGQKIEKIKYDDAVYYITVVVTDNGLGQLVAEVSIAKSVEPTAMVEEISFVNVYEAPPVNPETGDSNELLMWLAIVVVTGSMFTKIMISKRKEAQEA